MSTLEDQFVRLLRTFDLVQARYAARRSRSNQPSLFLGMILLVAVQCKKYAQPVSADMGDFEF